MPKIVRTTDTDYRIITGDGGTITLDTTNATGNLSGTVVVKGDLEVNGGTTTIESIIATIDDNILLLSAGNTSSGLPVSLDRPRSSGIEIERGSLANSRWVYDDGIGWDLGGVTGIGAWIGTQGDIGAEQILPIKTSGIVSDHNLYVDTNDGVISVSGTNNYELKIWNYDNGVITPDPITNEITQDDDNIPNAKAVRDIVDYSLATVVIDKIQEDNSSIEVVDKNNVILNIIGVGPRTLVTTQNSHGFAINDTVTITGVQSSPNDAILQSLIGSWTITDVPSSTSFEFDANSIGADKSFYVSNSGRTVSAESEISVTVEGNNITNFYNNRINLADIEIKGTEIFTSSSNDDLVLSSSGIGSVKIKDTLEITKTPGDDDILLDPNPPLEGIKLYSKSQGTGKTGLYFVNENNYQDEVISKSRALLYSMLF
jgi:hypothetical protein